MVSNNGSHLLSLKVSQLSDSGLRYCLRLQSGVSWGFSPPKAFTETGGFISKVTHSPPWKVGPAIGQRHQLLSMYISG